MPKSITKSKKGNSSKQRKVEFSTQSDPIELSSDGLFLPEIQQAVTASRKRYVAVAPIIKDDGDDDEEDLEDDAQDTVVVTRGREVISKPKRRRTEEYDEDTGRNESQDFNMLLDFGKKKRDTAKKERLAYIEDFTKQLDRDEEGLKKELTDSTAQSGKKDAHFLDSFKAAFEMAAPLSNRSNNNGAHFAALYPEGQKLVANAKSLVHKFGEMVQTAEKLGEEVSMKNIWEEEDENLAGLLKTGRHIGVRKVQDILGVKSREREKKIEERDDVQTTFFVAGEVGRGSWASVARKQEKAAKKLIKASVVGV